MDRTEPLIKGEYPKQRIFLTWFTRLCLATFVLLLLLLHLFDRELNPLNTTISEYALGDLGQLMVIAFVILGLGTIALATGLFLVNFKTARARIGLMLLAAVGVSLILAGIFKTDRFGMETTAVGVVHAAVSMMAMTLVIIAMALWTRQMEADSRLIGYSPVLARLTFLSALLFTLFLLLSGSPVAGLGQRVFLTTILGWQFYATRVTLDHPPSIAAS